MLVFHRTRHVQAILAEGFQDSRDGSLREGATTPTIRFSDDPLDAIDKMEAEIVLFLDIPAATCELYAQSEPNQEIKIFYIPAQVANQYAKPKALTRTSATLLARLRRAKQLFLAQSGELHNLPPITYS